MKRIIIGLLSTALVAAVGAFLFSSDATLAAKTPSAYLKSMSPTSPHPGMVWIPAGTFQFGDTVTNLRINDLPVCG